jgi:hypothetical protein
VIGVRLLVKEDSAAAKKSGVLGAKSRLVEQENVVRNTGYSKKQKYTCKYVVHLSSVAKFQVSKKIIGQGGQNMKVILDGCRERN